MCVCVCSVFVCVFNVHHYAGSEHLKTFAQNCISVCLFGWLVLANWKISLRCKSVHKQHNCHSIQLLVHLTSSYPINLNYYYSNEASDRQLVLKQLMSKSSLLGNMFSNAEVSHWHSDLMTFRPYSFIFPRHWALLRRDRNCEGLPLDFICTDTPLMHVRSFI